MCENKQNLPKWNFFSIQDIIDGVKATEIMADSTIVAGARVICTACAGSESNSRMIKGGSLLLLQKSFELGHKDTTFFPFFTKCLVGDHICKPEIEGKAWQDYDEKKVTSNGDYSLLKDKSYMLCTKGFGIIYATENGQRVDQRQKDSLATLFRRWWMDKGELGYLKGMSLCNDYSRDPVNLNTGNFIYQQEDLIIDGITPLVFKRFYNNLDTRRGCLGNGWIHSFEIHLEIKKNYLTLFLEDGKEEIYQKISEELYQNKHTGLDFIKVIKNGSKFSYIYTRSDQNKHIFSMDGREQQRQDAYGNQIQFEYDDKGRLAEVKSYDAAFFFSYDDSGSLTAVMDHTERKVAFEYGAKSLEKVVDSNGNSTSYHYDENGNIQEIINPRNICTVYNEYDTYSRTIKQCFPDEGEIHFAYDDEQLMVEMKEQNGNKVKHYYDHKYRNIKTIYEDGQEQFTYNEQNKKIKYKDKRGYLTRYEYDRQGNETRKIDALKNQIYKTYDQHNQLQTVSVNGKIKLKNQYNEKNKLIKTTDGLGRNLEFTYNHQGLPTQLIRPDGGRYKFDYDFKGNLVMVTDPMDYRTVYEYDSLNRIAATTDANGNRLIFGYDNRNNLIKVTDSEGREQNYRYNESDQLISFSDHQNNTSYREYGVLKKPSKIIDAMGNETILEYDKMWNLCKVTDAIGGVKQYIYNHANLLEQVISPLGGCTRYSYDSNGNRTTITDANGETTDFTYDPLNRITQIKEPGDVIHQYEYNAEGQVVTYIDPMNQKTCYEYDQAGQKIKEINPDGHETCFFYNLLSKITEIKKAGLVLIRYEYDSRGLLTREFQVDGNTVTYDYDGNQNLIKKTDQKGRILNYEYDNWNRVTKIKSNQGQESQYEYDSIGNLAKMTDANGNQTRYLYDPCGHLIGVIDAQGNQTAYSYDSVGNVIHIIQCGEPVFTDKKEDFDIKEVLKRNKEEQIFKVTTFARNTAGMVDSITDQMGNSERYSYDLSGNLIGKLDRDGYLTSYTYENGNLVRILYGDGRDVKLRYNAFRQLIQFEDWLGITRLEQDTLGRTIKVTDHNDQQLSYSWGKWNERTSMTYPDGQTVFYKYDENLHLKEVESKDIKVQYAYDQAGNLVEKSFLNGIKSTYEYDELGQLKRLTHWNKRDMWDEYQYNYDSLGNKTGIEKYRSGRKREDGSYRYHYDSLNRLHQVIKDGCLMRSYEYDRFGNRTRLIEDKKTTGYTYNCLNQLISKADYLGDGNKSEETYCYDKRGNLIEVNKNGRLTNQYYFGALGRLERAMNHESGVGADYQYNGIGNRTGKIEGLPETPVAPDKYINHWNLNPTREIQDVIDLTKKYHNLIQRTETDKVNSFVWDGGILSETGQDGSFYYLKDELGSPLRVMDETGHIRQICSYDEFGQEQRGTLHKAITFGYTGYQKDMVTGTYFAQAREYSPQVGQFISRDLENFISVSSPLSVNLYTYCLSNPLKYVDCDGHDCYVFYLPEWKGEAKDDRKRLAEHYGIPESEVHLVEIKNNQDLTDGWNAMGSVDGKSVDIQGVVINTHANPNVLGYGSNSSDNFGASDIAALNSKDIDKLILYGCNSGHMDYAGTNVPSEFTKVVNNAPVLASDGTVYSSKSILWLFGEMKYSSKADDSFKNLLNNGDRDNLGWIVYYLKNGVVETKETGEKNMKLKGLLEACEL